MVHTKTFPEPEWPVVTERKMSGPTDEEHQINQLFEPLSRSKSVELAGVIVNVAVDIARYQRSPEVNQAHRERLERCVRFFANARLVGVCKDKPELLDEVVARLETVPWSTVADAPRPVIVRPAPDSQDETTFALLYVTHSS